MSALVIDVTSDLLDAPRVATPAPAPVSVERQVQFTFDLRAGALRRDIYDVLADRMAQLGLDVSWSDARSGVLGTRRRFTVRGSRALVQRLITELGRDLGWQPGAVALPR